VFSGTQRRTVTRQNFGQNLSEKVSSPSVDSPPQLRLKQPSSRGILETAVKAIITIGDRGLIESVNPATEHLFGYNASELVGQNVKVLMPEPYKSEHDNYVANHLQSGVKRIIGMGREVRDRRKNGETFPLHLSVSEFQVEGRRYFTGMIQDLSDRPFRDAATWTRRSFTSMITWSASRKCCAERLASTYYYQLRYSPPSGRSEPTRTNCRAPSSTWVSTRAMLCPKAASSSSKPATACEAIDHSQAKGGTATLILGGRAKPSWSSRCAPSDDRAPKVHPLPRPGSKRWPTAIDILSKRDPIDHPSHRRVKNGSKRGVSDGMPDPVSEIDNWTY
jgi:PAS domain S-box-containing protein